MAEPGNDPGAPGALDEEPPEDFDAPPPFLGSWRNIYLLVIGTLAACVVLFSLFSYVYR